MTIYSELPKNVYRISEVLAHIWKDGDRRKGA